MNASSEMGLTSKIFILLLITIAIAGSFILVALASIPSGFKYKVEYAQIESQEELAKLPISKMAVSEKVSLRGTLMIKGLTNQPIGFEKLYVYIPKFEGHLEIYADGKELFSKESPKFLGNSGFAVFPLKIKENGSLPSYEFVLSQGFKKFVLMSDIYIAPYSSLQPALSNQSLMELLRVSVFGMNLTVLVICLFLLSTNTELYLTLPAFLISFYFLISSINSVDPMLSIPNSFVFKLLLASPMLGTNIFLFAQRLLDKVEKRHFRRSQIFATSASMILIFIGNTLLKNFDPFPLSVAVASIIVPMLMIVSQNLRAGLRNSNFRFQIFSIMLLFFTFAVLHDALFRFGFLGSQNNLISVARITFIFICAYTLSSYSLDGAKRLKNSNEVLSAALIERTNELNIQFAKKEKLKTQSAIESERRRLRQEFEEELHDGALSYISIINVMTAESSNSTLIQINKLSRFASNEIRFMMETSDRQTMTLLAALSLLRRQFIDRLSELGIEIKMDVDRLSECSDVNHKVVIDTIRILQELVHNAAIRASAKRIAIVGTPIKIRNRENDELFGFRIMVSNTGGNTYIPTQKLGNGLRNIINRSKRIKASIEITPIAGGASALLVWPATD